MRVGGIQGRGKWTVGRVLVADSDADHLVGFYSLVAAELVSVHLILWPHTGIVCAMRLSWNLLAGFYQLPSRSRWQTNCTGEALFHIFDHIHIEGPPGPEIYLFSDVTCSPIVDPSS